ncbi:MAG: ankyrin repeat domain-containing protein [Chloroflexales bacterium]|nr:ankyrin repeat domain-containing protein [Chloroflexales bacterium]
MLFIAAERKRVELTQWLIAQSLDVNARDISGRTSLFAAVGPDPYGQSKAIVEVLLAAGADANAVDATGHSILAEARANQHTEIVAVLLDAGAREWLYCIIPERRLSA